MQELRNLETSQLVDLLSQYTADYTRRMSEGTTEDEYAKLKLTIKALQTEIDIRKNSSKGSDTNITALPDFS